jgi:hypothetical protein
LGGNRRFRCLFVLPRATGQKATLLKEISALAETEGFEPSIELYNPITV